MNKQILFASALAVLGLTSCEKELTDDIGDVGSGQGKNSLLQVRTRGSGENNGSVDDGSAVGNSNNFPKAGDTYEGCYVLASVVANDGESAELTLLSPNEKYYSMW